MVDRLDSRSHGAVKYWPIGLLRIYTGLFFAWNGIGKISRGSFADGMEGFLNGQLQNSFAFYRPFIETVILPNKTLFAALVSWGELTIGLALIVAPATIDPATCHRAVQEPCLDYPTPAKTTSDRRCLRVRASRYVHGSSGPASLRSLNLLPTAKTGVCRITRHRARLSFRRAPCRARRI